MDKIEEILTRGVEKIYPNKENLEKVLRSGKKLRLYQGFDPTGTKLHIGHAVAIRKLREFQKLGHHVIFLVGDGTGQAGDPSGKTKARDKFLTREKLRKNARDYVNQASKIVRFEGSNPAEILYNSDWLNKLKLVKILNIAQQFSVQQLLERDIFQERIKKNETINLREFLYPLLQGYDSVAMNIDLEVGGTDQTFNMLTGRHLVKIFQNREKIVMTVPLLTDKQGRKIGKTEGNVIGITDEPNELFSKIMSLGDDSIIPSFILLTDLSLPEIEKIKKQIKKGENPITFKKLLAYELTKEFNSQEEAEKAQEEFEKVFQKGEIPANIPIVEISKKTLPALELFTHPKLLESRSEVKRLIAGGAIEIAGKRIESHKELITLPAEGAIVKIGKRRVIKLTPK
ncbi:tyrosine--tRNA ligase [Candidatus Woesebacteria bacterium]|nr:tyrosine--tRNA ligase [Candidatus Woesebacteria bacterium]